MARDQSSGDRSQRRPEKRSRRTSVKRGRKESQRGGKRSGTSGSGNSARRGSGNRGSQFSYDRTQKSVQKRADQSGGNSDYFIKDSYKVFKPSEKNHIRILPPTWDDAQHFAYDTYINYGIGPDNSVFLSLFAMNDEDDPIAEERKNAEKEGDIDYAEELKPTKRPICYIIDRNDEDKGVQVYPMPWSLDRDIAMLMIDKRSGEVIPIDDLDDGFDVFFDRKGKGKRMQYIGVEIDRSSSPVFDSEDEMDDLIEFLEENPLPDCLQFFDYDHISKVFDAEAAKARVDRDDDDVDDDDDDDNSRSSRSGSDKLSWKEVHAMSFEDLEDLVDDEDLDLDLDPFEDDDEGLADEICEELGIDKPRRSSRRERGSSGRDKMRSMRSDRGSEKDDDDDQGSSSKKRTRKRTRRS